MGRRSAGIYEVKECERIELSDLLTNSYIKKGYRVRSTLEWVQNGEPTSEIRIESLYLKDEKYVRLVYETTDEQGRHVEHLDYKIQLVTVPSNLGKGKVPYFLCPNLNIKCRVLYRAYGSNRWFSRQYYETEGFRIYYPSQAVSKESYPRERKRHISQKIDTIWGKKNFHLYHRGKKTRAFKKLEKLEIARAKWKGICDKQLIGKLGYLYSRFSDSLNKKW